MNKNSRMRSLYLSGEWVFTLFHNVIPYLRQEGFACKQQFFIVGLMYNLIFSSYEKLDLVAVDTGRSAQLLRHAISAGGLGFKSRIG